MTSMAGATAAKSAKPAMSSTKFSVDRESSGSPTKPT
jgi:hypothetical protein